MTSLMDEGMKGQSQIKKKWYTYQLQVDPATIEAVEAFTITLLCALFLTEQIETLKHLRLTSNLKYQKKNA